MAKLLVAVLFQVDEGWSVLRAWEEAGVREVLKTCEVSISRQCSVPGFSPVLTPSLPLPLNGGGNRYNPLPRLFPWERRAQFIAPLRPLPS